jgi:hypothetical protein
MVHLLAAGFHSNILGSLAQAARKKSTITVDQAMMLGIAMLKIENVTCGTVGSSCGGSGSMENLLL